MDKPPDDDVMRKPGPERVGNTIMVEIKGCLLPANDDQEALAFLLPGDSNHSIPIFSTIGGLEAFMEMVEAPHYRVIVVHDVEAFIASIPLHLRVVLDPRSTPKGIEGELVHLPRSGADAN